MDICKVCFSITKFIESSGRLTKTNTSTMKALDITVQDIKLILEELN